jgi:hypothetical protein
MTVLAMFLIANIAAHRPDDKSANLQTSQDVAAKRLNVSTRSVADAVKVRRVPLV